MKNYTINRQFGFVRLPFEISSDSDDLLREFRKDEMADNRLAQEIDTINDYEVTAFKPRFSTVIFDIFFHRRIDTLVTEDIRTMLSTPYIDYYDRMKAYFANINPDADLDFISQVPRSITSYPTFWNSFGYPFYTKKETWYDTSTPPQLLPKRFDPRSYLYNSFLKVNFFTTPYAATQDLLFQSVIYVNPRWCELEGDVNGSWHRPTFRLDKTTDGYYLYWLDNYAIDTFYVSFQFWDALNGKMINLLPCNVKAYEKQWVQSVNSGFDQRMLYLEYKLSYSSKEYAIREFNTEEKVWNMNPNPIRLYEVIFDDFFAALNPNIIVENGIGTGTTTPTLSNFDLDLSAVSVDLTPTTTLNVHYTPELTFKDVRDELKQYNVFLPDKFAKTIKVKNNSNVPVYLKDVVMEITSQDGSSRMYRKTMQKKGFFNYPPTFRTLYHLYSVPTPNMSTGNGLQPHFSEVYFPDRLFEKSEDFGQTVAVYGEDTMTTYNPWDSAAWMGQYYPMTDDNMLAWGELFAENMSVAHNGDDLTPIDPNGTMSLDLAWSLGTKYAYTYIEPIVYQLCHNTFSEGDHKYTAELNYSIKLYFNNLTGTLPKENNVVTFNVLSKYVFNYIGRESGGGGGGNGGGGKPKPQRQ